MVQAKILAVDDRPQNLFALQKLLQPLPVEIVATTSPVEALSLALDHEFCMAIVDVQMPEMDGYELVALLRTQVSTSHMPVIFVSAIYSDEYHHQLGYEAGAVDFLSKPFVPEILLSKVAVFLDLYKQRQEQKLLIARLNDANQSLRELNTEKDRLIGMVAHDLRNPLGNIRGLSELLLTPDIGLSPAGRNDMVNDIFSQAEYMLALINDLLDVSQIESGALALRKETVDLAGFLAGLIDHHQRLALSTKGSTVALDEVPQEMIECDPVRLRQVIDNLVSNGVKYAPPGCRTVVSVERFAQELRISVRDEGPGIPVDEQDLVFDYFCRVSTVPTGDEKSTGLGLAISARIVRAHGGAIGVESQPGAGATFWFTLPRSPKGVEKLADGNHDEFPVRHYA